MRWSSQNISSDTGGAGGPREGLNSHGRSKLRMVLLQKSEGGVRFEVPTPSYHPPFREGPTAGIFRPFPFPFAFAFFLPTNKKNVIGPIHNLGQSRLRTYVCSYVSVRQKDRGKSVASPSPPRSRSVVPPPSFAPPPPLPSPSPSSPSTPRTRGFGAASRLPPSTPRTRGFGAASRILPRPPSSSSLPSCSCSYSPPPPDETEMFVSTFCPSFRRFFLGGNIVEEIPFLFRLFFRFYGVLLLSLSSPP